MNFDYDSIKSRLEAERCPVHNQAPEIEILPDKQVGIKTCCQDFRETMAETLKENIADQIRNSILDTFHGTQSGII